MHVKPGANLVNHFRRHVLKLGLLSATGAVASQLLGRPAHAEATSTEGLTLGFSTYGMQQAKTEDAIKSLAAIGYDSVELCVRAGWDASSEQMPAARRQAVKQQLNDQGLRLTSLMEHLDLKRDAAAHRRDLERLRTACELAHDLADPCPLVQSVLGGSGKWEDDKAWFPDRLADWAALAAKTKTIIAIKPHRGGSVSQPSEAVWLFEKLQRPQWLKMVYDYSHYAFRDLPLDETVRIALPYTAHVAAKDVKLEGKNAVFALAGETGAVDFPRLLRLLYDGGYRGDINCEVSMMISGRPNYSPQAAAETCYRNVSAAFEKAQVARR